MKLLHHPSSVRIHEVIGSKTKIYLVMEYVSGGQLSDKLVRFILLHLEFTDYDPESF